LGFEKSQRSVTHDSLRYINILTYLLTYLLTYMLCSFFSYFTNCVLSVGNSVNIGLQYVQRPGGQAIYTVSQKTSPTFLAITRESIDGFL